MKTCEVTCPTCGELFVVISPPAAEQPCRVDYDCEICCRPLVLEFDADHATAMGIGD